MIEETELEKAGIDVEKGMLYTQGDKEAYESFLKTFYDDQTYQKMLACIEKKDTENAYLHACSLCGSSSYLGMNSLHDSLYQLMDEMRSGTFKQSALVVNEVKDRYNAIMKVLKDVLK